MSPLFTLDRRTLLAAAGALAASPALAQERSSMSRLYPVLLAVIDAWHRQDVEGVLAHVTDDIVWRNSSGFAPAIRGKAAMRTALQGMAPVIKTNKWRIFDYAESETRLFMEGVDEFWLTTGQHVAIPYAGVLEFRGALIHEWREYFDGRISAAMKAGQPITPEVEEMIGRPVAR
ncbi:nuclear transport factor 2 family protein [Phenylobacterium soli]|uniref:Nuclear transport factor 2 family protein n=1 Tax=Phenylobacterium soli TaxID=2170551 RepID=A0A328AQT8_9CAUL|nr:nuclear transport factor 2 family protein [Phenylobacterium soli]RAK56106.1 nuclear transport factor 2 family protein [Phenylobacterium soli]